MTLNQLISDEVFASLPANASDRDLLAARRDVIKSLQGALKKDLEYTEKTAIQAGFAHKWSKKNNSATYEARSMPTLDSVIKQGLYPDSDGYTSGGPEGITKPNIKAIRKWLLNQVKVSQKNGMFTWME